MVSTLNGSRLKTITVSGSSLSRQMTDMCVGASLSLSVKKVTEMSLVFQDSMDLDLFNSKLFTVGASIRYGEWFLVCDGLGLATGAAGPTIAVKAPSKFVTALKKQTGAKSWGTVPLSSWVAGIGQSLGMATIVQPGLGNKLIVRKAAEDGANAESTWDVLTQQSREAGAWLFEYGSALVFAKPSYLVKATWKRRVWSLYWNSFSDYSPGMAGMPEYADKPGTELREQLTVKLLSADADTARPGDALVLKGRTVGPMGGTWIINAVDFPLHIAGVVTVKCQRPIDPKVVPPREETARRTSSSAGSKSAKRETTAGGKRVSKAPIAAGMSSALNTWVRNVNGRYIDMDAAFGSQCVDLANHYHIYCVGGSGLVYANGNQWMANAPAALYEKYPIGAANGETGSPGDIACWGSFYGGGYGHVAIVLEDHGNSLKVMTQNPGGAHVDTLSKQGLQGYLRPIRVNQGGGAAGVRGPMKVF